MVEVGDAQPHRGDVVPQGNQFIPEFCFTKVKIKFYIIMKDDTKLYGLFHRHYCPFSFYSLPFFLEEKGY